MKKKEDKKNDSNMARLLSTTTYGGGSTFKNLPVLYRYNLSKEDETTLRKEMTAHRDHDLCWHNHALWRTEVLIPAYDRRTEQQFIDTRNALCLVRAFREEIMQLRNLSSLQQGFLHAQVGQVCRDWKINNGEGWVLWLVGSWNPSTAKYPPLHSQTPSESFHPWAIELNYLREPEARPDICLSATITLNAGVSGREAQRIAAYAQKILEPSTRRKGRPGITDMERETLRSMFVKLGIPKPSRRTAMILKVQKACMQSDYPRQFSKSVIGQELRQWLLEQKQRVRRYTTIEPS